MRRAGAVVRHTRRRIGGGVTAPPPYLNNPYAIFKKSELNRVANGDGLHSFRRGCRAYCGQHAQSLDHVHPKARGGLTVRQNLVPACLRCNRLKSHREVFSWWRLQPFWCADAQASLIAWLRSGE